MAQQIVELVTAGATAIMAILTAINVFLTRHLVKSNTRPLVLIEEVIGISVNQVMIHVRNYGPGPAVDLSIAVDGTHFGQVLEPTKVSGTVNSCISGCEEVYLNVACRAGEKYPRDFDRLSVIPVHVSSVDESFLIKQNSITVALRYKGIDGATYKAYYSRDQHSASRTKPSVPSRLLRALSGFRTTPGWVKKKLGL